MIFLLEVQDGYHPAALTRMPRAFRQLGIAAAIGAVTACAMVSESPPLISHPESANDEDWKIDARSHNGLWTDTITLYVNGVPVATGSVDPIHHAGVRLAGDYRHHIVLGICSVSDSGDHECGVYVDGSSEGMLDF